MECYSAMISVTTDTCKIMDESLKFEKKTDTKEYIMYDYIYINFKNRQHLPMMRSAAACRCDGALLMGALQSFLG